MGGLALSSHLQETCAARARKHESMKTSPDAAVAYLPEAQFPWRERSTAECTDLRLAAHKLACNPGSSSAWRHSSEINRLAQCCLEIQQGQHSRRAPQHDAARLAAQRPLVPLVVQAVNVGGLGQRRGGVALEQRLLRQGKGNDIGRVRAGA